MKWVLLLLLTVAAGPDKFNHETAEGRWLHSLRNIYGNSCCDISDCRRTGIKPGPEGIEAWIGKEEFGPSAPDEWRLIPLQEIRSRRNRPSNVRGAFVCFLNNKIVCSDLEGGS